MSSPPRAINHSLLFTHSLTRSLTRFETKDIDFFDSKQASQQENPEKASIDEDRRHRRCRRRSNQIRHFHNSFGGQA